MVYFLQRYGYSLLFFAALAENLGAPIPSYPLILLGAAYIMLYWKGYGAISAK
jgi:membrane protein DedA with SNARE-associated domain